MRFPARMTVRALVACVALVAFNATGTAGSDPGKNDRKTETSPKAAEGPVEPILEANAQTVEKVLEADEGDTLLDLLLKAGVTRTDADKAIEALKQVYDPKALKIRQRVRVTFDRGPGNAGTGPLSGVSLQPDGLRQIAARRAAGQFAASETRRALTRQLAHFDGTIKGSLFEAASAQGLPPVILVEMIRAFSYDVDFQRDIQPGDSFEVMFERFVDKNGKVVRNGDIVFAKLTLSGEANPIYRYVDENGQADYYGPTGESVRKALLRTPVDGARISSSFGMRKNPVLGFSMMHKGVDFAVPTGTPVMAAGSGRIEYAGANGAYGYYVRIRHDPLHSTAYAHLSHFAQGIRVGKQVSQGQVVGYSGATGRATGPHLHYEVLLHDQQVNPMSVKFQSGTRLAGKELNKFLAMAKEAGTLLAQTPVNSKLAQR